ncbi:preprotein translocase subunit SecY [Candidatus Peregrinibacteria bacterium CG_4_9_14_0_2_um_filter_53_11]|nr:MAG: preprotein translocase subunit SecY [Candidatus Peregrinibacteria bacterium CG_4_9_14_0_2_um_filter_53_11]
MKYLSQIWRSRDLRNKILFTIGALLVFRLTTQISIPGANLDAIRAIFQQNNLLGIFSALTGGSAENFSIVLMGVSPYINASIIVQLLTVIIPKLEALSKEGEQGQKRINKYTRWLTLPLAVLQSYGMIILLNSQSQIPIVDNITDPTVILPIMLTITTGTVFLMWLGEIITEKGIGNGISLIIFAGIISSIPQILAQNLYLGAADTSAFIPFVANILFTIIMLVVIVLVTEAERRIPITYAGHKTQIRQDQSRLPIKINQAGMIPIIFAVSLINFPGLIGQFMQRSANESIRSFGETLITSLTPDSALYLTLYFIFIVLFTYFYVSITFNPEKVSENIQKRGGYVPGIRPGSQTVEHIGGISQRLTLFGGTFLGLIAIAPVVLNQVFFGSSGANSVSNLISGAGMIIIVGVVLELVRQINAQLIMHDYDKLA